jgi:hypothetical protein
MRIGIDFDNTLVGYDHLFADSALRRNWDGIPLNRGKTALRDAVRERPDGENDWQSLQAEVYGSRMAEARFIEGADLFLSMCMTLGVPVAVISHKTQYAAADPGGVDLHEVAMNWMEAHKFFSGDGFGVKRKNVFFEPTRADKINRIRSHGCTHFIDDLVEVLSAPDFPEDVRRYLIGGQASGNVPGVQTVQDWQGITNDLFE